MRRCRPPVAILALSLVACQADPVETRPITEQDHIDLANKHDAPVNQGRVGDPGTLFITLDQNLRTWRDLMLSADTNRKLELDSLEEAITRLVYNNFDAILAGLVGDDPEHQTTAAAALGFSRIPGPDEPGGDPRFLPVHDRAIRPLVELLESGNDQLTLNALLSLGRIASRETPRTLLYEILVGHHNPDVRSNAALALSRLLRPGDQSEAIGQLYAALGDDSDKVRLHVLTAIGALRDPASQGQVLNTFRNDPSALVRANAAHVLGRIGTARAVPYLANGLSDQTPIVRLASYRSLCRLTDEDLGKKPKPWMEWYADEVNAP